MGRAVRGRPQPPDIVDGDGLSLGQIAVQPANQRGWGFLKFGNIGRGVALAPFMRIAKPQKIGRIFDHPCPVGARRIADEGQKL